jgi:hypothetical protein
MMKKLMSIGLMAALSGTGMVALAQSSTQNPAPTQQTAQTTTPRTQTTPRVETQRDATAAKQATPATPSSKDAMTQHTELQAMDTNKDGLVSEQEYMSHYETAYGKIKKDSAGMISLMDLESSTPAPTTR